MRLFITIIIGLIEEIINIYFQIKVKNVYDKRHHSKINRQFDTFGKMIYNVDGRRRI